ncbi:transposase [Salmonella enterica]|uniref:transposase n=1 Tax=Salmonella enterica TaxID=28901 RepID=UPI0035D1C166
MDEKKLKALAAKLANGLKAEADLNQFSRMLTKLTVETALNVELTDHLGHEKNAPQIGSKTRNGYSSKTLLYDDGEIELSTPRDRENTFEPQLIKKHQTHITQMYSHTVKNVLHCVRFRHRYHTSLFAIIYTPIPLRYLLYQKKKIVTRKYTQIYYVKLIISIITIEYIFKSTNL